MRHRIVILQHGSHGTCRDLSCVAQYLRGFESPPVVWEPRVNEGFRTDDGVVICGERFAKNVIEMFQSFYSTLSLSTLSTSTTTVELSFVAHSMGGLIIREALPLIFKEIQSKQDYINIKWKLFCSIAVPHAGVRQMDAFIRSYLGRFIGRFYSTAYHDMFLQSNVLTERLLSKEYLSCLAAFEKRLLISSINDLLVPLMSSGFLLKPNQQLHYHHIHSSSQEERNERTQTIEERMTTMCAVNEEEMYTKRHQLTELNEREWPREKFPLERRLVDELLRSAGPFESVVVDLRPSAAASTYQTQLALHGAQQLSHRALICKPPLHPLDDLFGFVSKVAACEAVME
ncbi:uncharacterized protein TM35_000241680 [Trypanosoma theileri]|uniref:DUF676 domain-containing protein n=1 Tax=Trypanosoma theileri TaxID=67003 RepID=A0A1X0NR47_9TRYP|nr:uncharacterized protein TM35_000241680 [Trypanosoma theileri]ORC87018.1 hypothetical protein TM35_000241680 [Trypanosoma theileri]